MLQRHKDTILSALDMKLASVKRMRNSKNDPRFKEIFDIEEQDISMAKSYITNMETTKPEPRK